MRVGLLQRSQTSIRFDRWRGDSFSTIPPGLCAPRPLRCRFTMLSRSTVARFFSGMTRSNLPVLPRSLPEMTRTVSPFLRRVGIRAGRTPLPARLFAAALIARNLSNDLGREGDDLHESLRPQLARHRTEDAGADGLALVVDQHRRVVVEADVGAVGSADLLRRADH